MTAGMSDTVVPGPGRIVALLLVAEDAAALDIHIDGETLLQRSIGILTANPRISHVVVGTPVTLLAATESACAELPLPVMALGLGPDPIRDLATSITGPATEVIVLHDAARGTVRPALVDAVIDEVIAGAAACAPLTGVTDTVKQVIDGRVLATIDRTTLVSLQTPQAFSVSALRQRSSDAAPLLLLDVDGDVRYVTGGPEAQRIPVPEAGVLAEALLRWQRVTEIRD
jgi:2-C-methyl-D-erythritol 4-phosphate cytidylyltransferase